MYIGKTAVEYIEDKHKAIKYAMGPPNMMQNKPHLRNHTNIQKQQSSTFLKLTTRNLLI